jgi:pantothenate kinase type III
MRVELAADPQVFITGGDAAGLAPLIDHDTRFVPHLCLAGIALIALRRLALRTAADDGAGE